MTKVTVVIPFRDRGLDPRRAANLELVMAWWWAYGYTPIIQSDGLSGDAPFNRHRAYNRAVSGNPDTDVFVFTEADMLIHPQQIIEAVRLAEHRVGLVVPFTQYRYLSDLSTDWLRGMYHDAPSDVLAQWWALPYQDKDSIFGMEPESTMDGGKSIGAVNVVSRMTLDITGGFTEATSGNWYDDNITEEGFAYLTGNHTRWVDGPAVHLYHLPGWTGDHLSEQDRKATKRNRDLLYLMRHDIRHGDRAAVKSLLSYRQVYAQETGR